MQTEYILEDFGYKKQISRFNEEGNRIVVIKVESFDEDVELQFVLRSLNQNIKMFDDTYYQSPDNKDGLNRQPIIS